MGITVNESMRIGGLTRCKVVAGKNGLDREVQYVTVMEVPDAIQWLKGNDLLLTSLYAIKDDPIAQERIVEQLVQKGSSGLAIKTQRFFEEIPPVIINEGNRLDFPIIEINKDVSYLDIITPLMSAILEESSPKKEDIEELFQWITELALAGKGIDAIIDALTKILGNSVTLESEIALIDVNVKHDIAPLNALQKNELRKFKRPVNMVRVLNGKKVSCIVSPLILGQEINGYITCWRTERDFQQLDYSVLERVLPLFALEFLKVKTKADVEQKFRNEFLSEILSGRNIKGREFIEKAKIYDWDLTKNYQVMMLDIDQFEAIVEKYEHNEVLIQEIKSNVLHNVEKAVRNHHRSSIVGGWSDLIVILYPIDETTEYSKEKILSIASDLQSKLNQQLPDMTFTIGIGRFYPKLEGIHLGYKEAMKAINLGRTTMGRNTCIHFDDLGVYRILSQVSDRSELESLYSETVGKLERYDREHNGNLTETLTAYFRFNCLLAETAHQLFIHVNTLKYRLSKIEQITGCRMNDIEGRFQLYLGLKIKMIFRDG